MSFNLIISILVGLFCSLPTHAMQRTSTINYPRVTAVNPHVPVSINGYMYYPSSMYLGGSLLEAVERDFLNVVQYLTPQTDLNTSNLTGDTSLHRAADLGRLEMVKILLQAGANMHLSTNRATSDRLCAYSWPSGSSSLTSSSRNVRCNRKHEHAFLLNISGCWCKCKQN